MGEIISFLILTATIGISGAIYPGPLTALIVSQAIKYGIREGIKTSFAPLITDFPIIIAVSLIISKISQSNSVIGVISILGGGYLLYLAYESFKAKALTISLKLEKPRSLRKGVITNFLNPAVYIFWLTIGPAMIQRAWLIAPWMVIIYMIVSYTFYISTYVAVAVLVGKFRNALQSKLYMLMVKGIGIVLAIFSISFLIRGLRLLQLLS